MFWCCCGQDGPTLAVPIRVIRNTFVNGYGSNIAGDALTGFGTTNPFAYPGQFPNITDQADTTTSPIQIGAKIFTYAFPDREPEPFTGSITAMYFGCSMSQQVDIPASATIVSAILRARRHVAITSNPSTTNQAFIRVCDGTEELPAQYPWNSDTWGGANPVIGGFSFLPHRPVEFFGDFSADITTDVQTVVNKPSWGPSLDAKYISLIVYTRYKAAWWVNNIHPTLDFPAKPATNTAIWHSNPEGTTVNDQTNAVIDILWS